MHSRLLQLVLPVCSHLRRLDDYVAGGATAASHTQFLEYESWRRIMSGPAHNRLITTMWRDPLPPLPCPVNIKIQSQSIFGYDVDLRQGLAINRASDLVRFTLRLPYSAAQLSNLVDRHVSASRGHGVILPSKTHV